MAFKDDKPPVIKITGPLYSLNLPESLPPAKKPPPLLNLAFEKKGNTKVQDDVKTKRSVGAVKVEFTPLENTLFATLNKYNDDASHMPLSIGNPIMIRAVASKLDYSD